MVFSTRFIRKYLKTIGFSPDVIVSHMPIGNEVNIKLQDYYALPFVCGIHESDLKVLRGGGRALEKAENIAWRSYGIKKPV